MRTLVIAWRNIWRHYRRSVVTISALSFALLAMIAYTGFADGYIHSMQRNMLDLELGDAQVHAPGYLDEPSLYDRIEATPARLDELAAQGYFASPRLLAAGLVASEDNSAPASFVGLEPDRDVDVSSIHDAVATGQWLDPSDPDGVVIGRKLARQLGVEVGSELVVLTQAADGSQGNELYRVRGIFKTVNDQVDRAGVFLPMSTMRELVVIPDGVHRIVVRVPPDDDDPRGALTRGTAHLRTVFPDGDVQSWRELQPSLASMMDSSASAIFVLYFIVYTAIAIVILNAMLMAVYERMREFGVMRALGVGPWGIAALVFCESLFECFVAIGVGLLASIPVLWFLTVHGIDLTNAVDGFSISGVAFDPVMKAKVSVASFVNPTVALVVIVVVAITYPAYRAATIPPVAAMRHN